MLTGDLKIQKQNVLNYVYKNKLDKPCLAHDAAYAISNDLARTTVSDKVFKDRASEISLLPQYDGFQRGLACIVYKYFDKKTGPGATSKAIANVNEVLAYDSHKAVIKVFKRGQMYLRFKNNFLAADLAEVNSLSSFNHGIKYFLYAIYVFIEYA